jgi:hypothetical protein
MGFLPSSTGRLLIWHIITALKIVRGIEIPEVMFGVFTKISVKGAVLKKY